MLDIPKNSETTETSAVTEKLHFQNGSAGLDELVKELEEPKQNLTPGGNESHTETKPENPPIEKLPDGKEKENITQVTEEKPNSKAFRSAKFITSVIDRSLAWGASEIAKSEDTTPFLAKPDETKEIESYWAECMKDWGGNIPPWLMLVVTYPMVYGPLYREAFRVRAINKEMIRKYIDEETKKLIAEQKLAETEEKLNAALAEQKKAQETLESLSLQEKKLKEKIQRTSKSVVKSKATGKKK